MNIVLYNVRRNLNRVYRTCYSFGIYDIYLIDCNLFKKGNLFSAKNKVKTYILNNINEVNMNKTIALENYYSLSIQNIDWKDINNILIGGESKGLPKKIKPKIKACIKTKNIFCLTVEAALAIILYEYRRKMNVNKM
jgi:tRNA(Leu) C34 or U34 (ribose-2'-O)-methylase TrmL